MPATISDLWADDIKVDVLTPLMILRSQETYLSNRTGSLLRARVFTMTSENTVKHEVNLIAHVLKYQVVILSATHSSELVYPTEIAARGFMSEDVHPDTGSPYRFESNSLEQRTANTQEEFIELLREVLHSGHVRSLMQSLIASSNESRSNLTNGSVSPTETSDQS